MAICRDCKKEQPKSSFSKAQLKKPAVDRRCKDCSGSGATTAPSADRSSPSPSSSSAVDPAASKIPEQGVLCDQAFLRNNEALYIGGRTVHLGSAALQPGKYFSYGKKNAFRHGQRQLESMLAMQQAFLNNENLPKTPFDVAGLELEVSTFREGTGFRKSGKVTRNLLNESVVMSSQRWYISVLSIEIIQQVIEAALPYRDVLRDFSPLLEKTEIPNSAVVFPASFPDATEQNRPDILLLLNELFAAPDNVNVWIFSEPDKEIACAWNGFKMDAKNAQLLLSASTVESTEKSPEEIIERIHHSDTMLEAVTCYWCEANSLTAESLSFCTACHKVSYCSKECQTFDWKSFHKVECKKKEKVIGASRLDYLKLDGARRPAFPSEIAPATDAKSVWRGDTILLYLVNVENLSLGSKTKGFPRGFHVKPRELMGH